MPKAELASDAAISGMCKKHMSVAPTVKEVSSLDGATKAAIIAWCAAQSEMPGSVSPPGWLAQWMDKAGAELFISGDDGAGVADQLPVEEPAPQESPRNEEEQEPGESEPAGTRHAARREILADLMAEDGTAAKRAAEKDGLLGAIWRVRQAVVRTDYGEGEEMRTAQGERSVFRYKAAREAFEMCRILWAAEGLHVYPDGEESTVSRNVETGPQYKRQLSDAVVTSRVSWRIQHLLSGEVSEAIVTTGVGVGMAGDAANIAKTAARKQMLCEAFGVNIHTEDDDVERRDQKP